MSKIFIQISLVLVLILQSGCKKYPNDPFFSTYTPETRLTKADGNVWSCVKFIDIDGAVTDVPDFHYVLKFYSNKSGVIGFSDVGDFYEISNGQEWSLNNKKDVLTFFGEHRIQKLTINEMELKDKLGNLYLFKKRKKESISSLDQKFLNIPLFGLFDENVKLKGFNDCSYLGNLQASNGTSNLGTVQGLFGNAIGGNGLVGELKNYTFTFSHFFQNSGYVTVWLKRSGISPVIKVNGVVVNNFSYLVGSASPGQASSWCNIKIKIDSPGNKTINISANTGSPYGVVSAIDEIRFWEKL